MEGSPKILFLDFDGVICTQRSHDAYRHPSETFMAHLDPVAVRLIWKVLDETEAKLVISSTWRINTERFNIEATLRNAGMPTVPLHEFWKTPCLLSGSRGQEIQSWLDDHGGPNCKYVIIDDDADMKEAQLSQFIQTDFNDGFLYRHYLRAMKLLS